MYIEIFLFRKICFPFRVSNFKQRTAILTYKSLNLNCLTLLLTAAIFHVYNPNVLCQDANIIPKSKQKTIKAILLSCKYLSKNSNSIYRYFTNYENKY